MKDLALDTELMAQEVAIERGLQGFNDIGLALAKIREGRLYRNDYATFDAYCQTRWQLTRIRAHRLIAAATITDAMEAVAEMLPIGNTPLPANEGQARELVGLAPEQAVEVMREAAEATNGKPTAEAIRNARQAQEMPAWYCEGGGHDVPGTVSAEQVGSRLCCPQCADDWRQPTVVEPSGNTYTPPAPRPAPKPIWSEEELALRKQLENGETIVVSLKGGIHANLIEWADSKGLYVRIDRNTIWGNPFVIGDDGDRDTVIAKYRDHYLPHKTRLQEKLPELLGSALGCWCAPEPCHGDVLKAEAEQ